MQWRCIGERKYLKLSILHCRFILTTEDIMEPKEKLEIIINERGLPPFFVTMKHGETCIMN
jgi:hypothetical protein